VELASIAAISSAFNASRIDPVTIAGAADSDVATETEADEEDDDDDDDDEDDVDAVERVGPTTAGGGHAIPRHVCIRQYSL